MPTNASKADTEMTIDEEIAQDWAAIQDKHKVEEPPEAVEAVEVSAEPEAKDERPRDEAGKFVEKAKAAPKVEVEKGVPETQALNSDANAAPLESKEQPQRDINRAPSTWKPIARQEWEKLSPTTRAEIHRREMDFQNGQAQLLPDARLGSEMRKVSEPYRMVIESQYGTPEKAMQAFLQTAASLQMGAPQQKLQTIVGICQQFGIDLSPLLQSGNPQTQQQPPQQVQDPRVDQLLAQQRQQEQQRQQREQMELESIANRWMAEKDQSGNPRYPYLNDVMPEMAVLIPQIKANKPELNHTQVLQEAYDRAVWANPDVRVVLQGSQQTELLAKQQAENQLRVAGAKRAASVNVSRRASTPSPAKPGSMVDTLTETARELGLIT